MIRFFLLLSPVLVLLSGCATSDFTPYVGKQKFWPTSEGSFLNSKYAVPIYYGLPEKPYEVIGIVTSSGHAMAAARLAKSKGADALILRKVLSENAGSYTTPVTATSFTTGSQLYG